ncbi:MAG TPA: hypothetical protein VF952_07540 [Chloroflexia bacterium]|jgi:hypothetical protein
MTGFNRTNPPTAGRHNATWTSAFLLLLALLQLALVPVLNGRDVELAPLFRVDSLGLLFGTAWTLTLATISIPLVRQSEVRMSGLFLGLIGVDLLVCAYAHNMVVLAVGWGMAGVGIWASQNVPGTCSKTNWAIFNAVGPAVIIAILAVATGFPIFAPPAGGVAEPWPAVAVMGGALVGAFTVSGGFRDGRERDKNEGANAPLTALYALIAPYILAKMLVTAPWHPVGAWLLVLFGMLTLLIGGYQAYVAYVSQEQQGHRPFSYALVGMALVGFGIAANSPLGAAGATWVMLVGLPWIVARWWRWAEIATLVAVVPGLWMLSQAALDTGYGVVAALLLPAYVLVAALTFFRRYETSLGWRWPVTLAVVLSLLAAALPQVVVEAMLKPAVRTMAGGVGALTTVGIEWGVGMLVRTAQGTVPAALPATGMGLAVFLAAVVLYWLKQLAGRATRQTGGDTQAE